MQNRWNNISTWEGGKTRSSNFYYNLFLQFTQKAATESRDPAGCIVQGRCFGERSSAAARNEIMVENLERITTQRMNQEMIDLNIKAYQRACIVLSLNPND